MSKRRIYYLDVAKAFGIFAVYFLHLGTVGGHGYSFAFYSVPLFFFWQVVRKLWQVNSRWAAPFERKCILFYYHGQCLQPYLC